jgi:hypothetical protein
VTGAPVPLGAYGLALPDLPGQRWLGPAAPSWPRWAMRRSFEPLPTQQELSDDQAVLRSLSGSTLRVDRAAQTTTLGAPADDPEAAFVHPLLAVTAIIHAEWSGRLAFHGGAFLDREGGAWGVLGERGDGKSSLMAALAASGAGVVADDLVVTDGATVFAGPRCVDLRESAAEHMGVGEDIGLVGQRRRIRVTLPAIEPELPLRGWIVLHWDEGTSFAPLSIAQRIEVLQRHRALRVGQRSPEAWLDLVAKPTVRFSRPRRWDELAPSLARLLAWTTDAAAGV